MKLNAIVDHICGRFWRVQVWDVDRADVIRTYTIEALDDNVAAQEGLSRFADRLSED